MNTTQLECFVSLAGTLNYMRTAEQLGLTQPAISKQIQSLEDELGAQLFNRTTRSVSLTQIGIHFLPEANSILKTYYSSKDWISSFNIHVKHSLNIGYMDPHAINGISTVLNKLVPMFPNLIPSLIQNQTDANLTKLVNGSLDIVIGIQDATFNSENIIFTKLHEDYFKCVMRKEHPLAKKCRRNKIKTVTSEMLWPYRQIITIPPYLLKNYFSLGRKIIPVNDKIDNIMCNNANEAYGLTLSGLGYVFIPEHQIMPHKDLVFFKWEESPHSPFGIYSRMDSYKNKTSEIHKFIELSKNLYQK